MCQGEDQILLLIIYRKVWPWLWLEIITFLQDYPLSKAVIYSSDLDLAGYYPNGMHLTPELIRLSQRIYFDDEYYHHHDLFLGN